MNLSQFVGKNQLSVMRSACKGEEGQHFIDKINELKQTIAGMPKTYETDGQGKSAVVYLHYFNSSSDWWITERDAESEQLQAFGMVSLNGWEPEQGYINIEELKGNNVEIDLYWEPKTLEEISK